MARSPGVEGDTAWLAECYWPGITEDEMAAAATRVRAMAPADGTSLSESILIVDDEMVFYLFRGATSDAVRALCERAGLACDRVLQARVLSAEA